MPCYTVGLDPVRRLVSLIKDVEGLKGMEADKPDQSAQFQLQSD